MKNPFAALFDRNAGVLISTGKDGNELRAHYLEASDTVTLVRWYPCGPFDFVQCLGRDEMAALASAMPAKPATRAPRKRRAK